MRAYCLKQINLTPMPCGISFVFIFLIALTFVYFYTRDQRIARSKLRDWLTLRVSWKKFLPMFQGDKCIACQNNGSSRMRFILTTDPGTLPGSMCPSRVYVRTNNIMWCPLPHKVKIKCSKCDVIWENPTHVAKLVFWVIVVMWKFELFSVQNFLLGSPVILVSKVTDVQRH